ncbi:MAG: hypothetical protein IT364_24250 [Candidatus Hydrogenedentes bacterium]|nr:hypothetical protein [Candidatus Hydrogenedentota bacterium]
MTRRRKSKQSRVGRNACLGASYLELTASLFILSVGIMASFQLFHFTMDRMRVVKEEGIAMRAMQNEVEWLRARPFEEIALGETPFASSTPELSQLVSATSRVKVDLFRPDLPELKRVEATLTWRGDQGRTVTRSIVSLVAEKRATP